MYKKQAKEKKRKTARERRKNEKDKKMRRIVVFGGETEQFLEIDKRAFGFSVVWSGCPQEYLDQWSAETAKMLIITWEKAGRNNGWIGYNSGLEALRKLQEIKTNGAAIIEATSEDYLRKLREIIESEVSTNG